MAAAGGKHEMPLVAGQWWACDHPERPAVPGVAVFDERCRFCLIGLEAAIVIGAIENVWRLDPVTGRPTGEIISPADLRSGIIEGWLLDTKKDPAQRPGLSPVG